MKISVEPAHHESDYFSAPSHHQDAHEQDEKNLSWDKQNGAPERGAPRVTHLLLDAA